MATRRSDIADVPDAGPARSSFPRPVTRPDVSNEITETVEGWQASLRYSQTTAHWIRNGSALCGRVNGFQGDLVPDVDPTSRPGQAPLCSSCRDRIAKEVG